MNKLTTIYPQAIEHTKLKVHEDINHYFETKETLPSFDQYLSDRSDYVEQIWTNVWLNKSTNDVPRNEKKQLLTEKGFEVHGIDRKLINKLFRDEMRTYRPFDAMEWIKDTYSGKADVWEKQYQDAKVNFIKREEQKQLEEQRHLIRSEIEDNAVAILEEQYDSFYLAI
ncbi:MAG: RNA helicase, partial [Bacillus sp. (in: firmicutes)]